MSPSSVVVPRGRDHRRPTGRDICNPEPKLYGDQSPGEKGALERLLRGFRQERRSRVLEGVREGKREVRTIRGRDFYGTSEAARCETREAWTRPATAPVLVV